MTDESIGGRGPSSLAATRDRYSSEGFDHPRIDIAAQDRGLRSRPISPQQLRRQQRIAQMQAPILVDQQRAHDEAVLFIVIGAAPESRVYACEPIDEAPIPGRQVL